MKDLFSSLPLTLYVFQINEVNILKRNREKELKVVVVIRSGGGSQMVVMMMVVVR